MKTERWEIDTEQKVIYPKDLLDNPDKSGGMGAHMKLSIIKDIVTIPIKNGCIYVSIPVSQENAKRILKDGSVDIWSSGYWSSIHSTKVMFKGTEEEIPLLRGLF
jgi:hypothetical protein